MSMAGEAKLVVCDGIATPPRMFSRNSGRRMRMLLRISRTILRHEGIQKERRFGVIITIERPEMESAMTLYRSIVVYAVTVDNYKCLSKDVQTGLKSPKSNERELDKDIQGRQSLKPRQHHPRLRIPRGLHPLQRHLRLNNSLAPSEPQQLSK